MMRPWQYLCVAALLVLQGAFAGQTSTARAVISLEITNDPPQIVDVTISPMRVYADTELHCEAKVADEAPGLARFEYLWEMDGILLSKEETMQAPLTPGKQVRCTVIAIDPAGLRSEPMSASSRVEETPLGAAITKGVVNALGSDVD